MNRIIALVDLDYFYAAVEEKRHQHQGKPIAVCVFSGRTKTSGAVASANYKARELGIKAGMPISSAMTLDKNKEVVFLPVDMPFYKSVSSRIMDILHSFADSFEQVSIDEAYLDITSCKGFREAGEIARKLKSEIKNKEGLTCSVGIGPNKLIAKMASEINKPDGVYVVDPEASRDFLFSSPLGKLFGIGKKTEQALNKIRINTVRQLAEADLSLLARTFGSGKGLLLKNRANGRDEGEVEQKERQQLSRLATLEKNTRDLEIISKMVGRLAREIEPRLAFRTISVICILADLEVHTRSQTLERPTKDMNLVIDVCNRLFREMLEENPDFILRRCGIRISGFGEAKPQKTLFSFSPGN